MSQRLKRTECAATGLALWLTGLNVAQQCAAATASADISNEIETIIVTAQKRAQSINDVPVSMTVASGDQLIAAGIASTADLAKLVPGLSAQPSPINTPIYTMRGVGFFDFSLAATPTVVIYNDEVPLPFGAMTKAAGLDLERVEVLKGPQGTLFGQNTTGGAINYIAARPTDSFKAGADLSYGRFNTVDAQGFISGPLTGGMKGRIAFRDIHADGWQENAFRNESLGAIRQQQGKILLDWDASARLKASLNLNGWIDKSDSQAPQRSETFISSPGNPNAAAIAALPALPNFDNRTADWSDTGDFGTKPLALRHDDNFGQAAIRVDYEISDSIKLTSITAYDHYKTDSLQDYDGSSLNIADLHSKGKIDTFTQEVRLSGRSGRLVWTAGANYEYDSTDDAYMFYAEDASTNFVAGMRGGPVIAINDQRIGTTAVFGNLEYQFDNKITVFSGARYTDRKDHQTAAGNFGDIAPFLGERNLDPTTYSFANIFTFLQQVLPPFVTNPIRLTATDNIVFGPDGYPLVKPITAHLDESNVSWRTGIDFKTPNDGLLYATISKGYKAGSFPTTGGATLREYAPVTQESVLAYEVGFKQPMWDRKMQINGAAFYYDYKNKQLRGRVLNPVFGPLDALVQIPKSRVIGVEGQITVRPITGLSVNVGASFLNTKIVEFTGYNQSGELANYAGFRFPFSPKVSVIADVQYDWAIPGGMGAFLGASSTTNSATTASIGDIPQLALKGYSLIDARAGVKSSTDNWRFWLWGRNITNENYFTSANQSQDVFVRFTGRPATYGASVSYRF